MNGVDPRLGTDIGVSGNSRALLILVGALLLTAQAVRARLIDEPGAVPEPEFRSASRNTVYRLPFDSRKGDDSP